MNLVSLILPVFNEKSCIKAFFLASKQLETKLVSLGVKIEYVFVDDGSTDGTANEISAYFEADNSRTIIFTRNFGKEAALCAGIEHARGDAVIPYDIDMQDPIDLVFDFVECWILKKARIVVGKRKDRSKEGLLKKSLASFFYKLLNALSDNPHLSNVGDFRLLDRTVVEKVLLLDERVRYTKGLMSWVGYQPVVIEYDRNERLDGSSKFNLAKLLRLAANGLLGFSIKPLFFVALLGALISLLALIFALVILFRTIFLGVDVPGYASIAIILSILSGVQILSIAIVGLYVGNIQEEVKRRPIYLVERIN